METQKKRDDDDLVYTNTDRETNNEQSEEKYWIEKIKTNDLESDKSETDERYQRNFQNYSKVLIAKKQEMMMTLLLLILIWILM